MIDNNNLEYANRAQGYKNVHFKANTCLFFRKTKAIKSHIG